MHKLFLNNKPPGDCYKLKGKTGDVSISLRFPARISHVSVHHISQALKFDARNAVHSFRVWGRLSKTDSNSYLLGEFEYQPTTKPGTPTVQKFPLVRPEYLDEVTFELLNNFGDESYTCVYHLGIHPHQNSHHGNLSEEEIQIRSERLMGLKQRAL
ncbi:hypothetical protein AAMO2058_001666700 [Amorphochlora amoebiformis]